MTVESKKPAGGASAAAGRGIFPRRRVPWPLFAAAAAFLASPAPAQQPGEPAVNPLTGEAIVSEAPDPLEGKPIAAIRIKGAYRMGRDLLLGMIGLKAGDPYHAKAVRENFQTLVKRDVFETLTVEAEDSPKGVVLTYTVRELPILHDIFIDNIKAMTQGQALDKLKENKLELQKGIAVDYERAKRAEEGLRLMLASQGLAGAEVRMRLDPLPSGEVNLIYSVTEGAPTRLRDLKIIGAGFFKERDLRAAMKDLRRQSLFSFMSTKNKFSRGKLEQGLDAWREMYEGSGFIDAEFGEPDVAPAGTKVRRRHWWRSRAANALAGTVKARYVDVTIRVTEGTRYRLHDIAWTGNALYKDDELRALFPGHRPSPWAKVPVLRWADPVRRLLFPDRKLEGQWVNRPLLKNFGKVVENKYGEKGYIFANANLSLKRRDDAAPDGAPWVDAEYKIGEDREYRLRRLEFEGNTKTYDHVLRREVGVKEGDIFNNTLYQIGLQKIEQLSLLEIGEAPKIDKLPDEDGWVGVKVAGKEARHDELQIGGGYSGVSGGSFNFSFSTRNFRGLGEVLGANATLGTRQSYYSVSLYEPWFLGRHVGASFSLNNTRTDYASYTRRSQGFGTGVALPQGPFSALRFNYNLERIRAANFATSVGSAAPVATDYRATVSSFSTAWNFDNRNNLFRATRGGSFNAALLVSGGPLGGNSDSWSPSLEASWYYSRWRKQTFAAHLNAVYVAAFGGQRLQLFQRLFTGGEYSLRAFPSNGVAPTTEEGREFIDEFRRIEGGNRMYTANFEYAFHLADPLDVVLFYDMGNVYHEKQTTDLTRALADAGLELRFFLPAIQAPLRMYWARNLTPRNCVSYRVCDDRTVFQFSIGQTF